MFGLTDWQQQQHDIDHANIRKFERQIKRAKNKYKRLSGRPGKEAKCAEAYKKMIEWKDVLFRYANYTVGNIPPGFGK
jgi:hypothetical protein